MNTNFAEMTWTQIEDYLIHKKTILIPVGSTEQHGPTGLNGTDFLTAWEIAKKVGTKTQTLVAPPLCFGMATHHMAFPGTITLSPATFIQVICEIIQSLSKHGFNRMIFVNGHGGNIAPLTTAFCQSKQNNENFALELFNWWILPDVITYEEKHFGEENGFHATCGEISVTMFTNPDSHKKISITNFPPTPARPHWPMAPAEFREFFPDGRMGSNPGLATAEHGKALFKIAVDSISRSIS